MNWEDLPFWPHTHDGVFSVRSTYRLLLDQAETEIEGSSSVGENLKVWKSIWSLRVPNRVKSLMWRVGTNSIPTRANLVKRQVLNDALCQECKLHSKDTMHALWSCPKLNDAWKVHFNQLQAATVHSVSFLEIIDSASLEKTSFDLFAMMVSAIWIRRNKVRVGTKQQFHWGRYLPRPMMLCRSFISYVLRMLRSREQLVLCVGGHPLQPV